MGFFKTHNSPKNTKSSLDYTLLQGDYTEPIKNLGLIRVKEQKGLYTLVNDSNVFTIGSFGITYNKADSSSILFEYGLEFVTTPETPLIVSNTGISLAIVLFNDQKEIIKTITPVQVLARHFNRDNQLIKKGALLPVDIVPNSTIGMHILLNNGKIGISKIMYEVKMYTDQSSMTIETVT